MNLIRETEIKGIKYQLTIFDALEGQERWFQLLLFLGPALGGAISSGSEDLTAIGPAVVSFCKTTTSKQYLDLIKAFAEKTNVLKEAKTAKGVQEIPVQLSKIYGAHFTGDYRSSMSWFLWAIKENFESFLDSDDKEKLLSAIGLMKASKSVAPESIGSSGDQG